MESWAQTQALIDKAKGGDQEAFGRVFEKYSRRIESFIRRQLGVRLGRTIEVDDILHESFLRAARSIGKFRGPGERSLVGWLLTIAQHAIQDQARRLGRKQPVALADFLEAADPSPGQVARRKERLERLRRALNALSKDHRRVILLARVRGLPIKEVARRMGKDYDATSQLLYRAALKLREIFGETDSLHLPDDCRLEDEEEWEDEDGNAEPPVN